MCSSDLVDDLVRQTSLFLVPMPCLFPGMIAEKSHHRGESLGLRALLRSLALTATHFERWQRGATLLEITEQVGFAKLFL